MACCSLGHGACSGGVGPWPSAGCLQVTSWGVGAGGWSSPESVESFMAKVGPLGPSPHGNQHISASHTRVCWVMVWGLGRVWPLEAGGEWVSAHPALSTVGNICCVQGGRGRVHVLSPRQEKGQVMRQGHSRPPESRSQKPILLHRLPYRELPAPLGSGGGVGLSRDGGRGRLLWGSAAASLPSLSCVPGRDIRDVGSCRWGWWEASQCSGEGDQVRDTRLALEWGAVPGFSAS